MTLTDIRTCAMNLERIDTHGHLETGVPDLRELVALFKFDQPATTASLIGSRLYAEGCRQAYGMDPGAFLTSAAPAELFARAAERRSAGARAMFERSLDEARVIGMFGFCDHAPERSDLREFSPRCRLLAYIDPAILGDFQTYSPDFPPPWPHYDRLCELFGPLGGLDDYLSALDAAIDGWRSHGVVGMKTSLAYTLGLSFGDPSPADARRAFAARRDMTPADIRTVQDFAFRHALRACRRNELPVVVHTGFQIWGHANLAQSNPMLLHPLLIDPRYKDMTFVLLHGGQPYIGETTYLAGMFPNVILDFTWIGWMAPTRFGFALAEWLEMVPPHKFCWGSDCGNEPETIAGVNHIVRTALADALESAVTRRVMDEPAAMAFLQQTYQDTPRRVFGVF